MLTLTSAVLSFNLNPFLILSFDNQFNMAFLSTTGKQDFLKYKFFESVGVQVSIISKVGVVRILFLHCNSARCWPRGQMRFQKIKVSFCQLSFFSEISKWSV